ncbi:hypothetical protein RB195_012251 [Necator americanus]|uniref:Uncharacterized protein n=1 Tax=Necator americanus TaxID=51031 RepID=A0ABR1D670_NECAM
MISCGTEGKCICGEAYRLLRRSRTHLKTKLRFRIWFFYQKGFLSKEGISMKFTIHSGKERRSTPSQNS